jgi:hypothetical protein
MATLDQRSVENAASGIAIDAAANMTVGKKIANRGEIRSGPTACPPRGHFLRQRTLLCCINGGQVERQL